MTTIILLLGLLAGILLSYPDFIPKFRRGYIRAKTQGQSLPTPDIADFYQDFYQICEEQNLKNWYNTLITVLILWESEFYPDTDLFALYNQTYENLRISAEDEQAIEVSAKLKDSYLSGDKVADLALIKTLLGRVDLLDRVEAKPVEEMKV
jgi:hypothetical protein